MVLDANDNSLVDNEDKLLCVMLQLLKSTAPRVGIVLNLNSATSVTESKVVA